MKTMNKTSRILSVIALVLCLMMLLGLNAFAAETENAVEGEVIEIRTWDDLKALDARVEGGDLMEGVTVKLMNDIDLYEMGADGEPVTFDPIGANKAYFKGTFDGQGHTIKNMYQSGWALHYDWDNYGTIGLFAYLWNATVKNVTIENAECFVEGGNVAAIAGCAWGDCTFENITVKNSTYATYNNRAAGIVGYTGGGGTMTFKDITVDKDTVIAGLWGSFDSSLGGVVGSIQDPTKHVFENVTVACRLDAYNDVTAAYKYYAYRMCGMLIGGIPVDANNQPILDNVTIGENVVIDYSNTLDYTYTDASGSWKRVEAGYTYGGVDMTQYPDAEVIYKPFNSIFGGEQYGSYGQDDHENIMVIGRVAAFDGEYFTSLEAAIKAADGSDEPVKLMADCGDDIVIAESLKLDLNGCSFTGHVTAVDGYKVVFEDGKYTAVEIPMIKVSTKAELDAALAAANDGDIIVLTADIDYGTAQLAINKAITLDLGGYTLTTRNAWGGMSVKNNATVKNGTIVHASNTAAIKVWNAAAFENLVIDVQGKGDANKTIGGIVLQSGSTTRVGSIKNVTIKGDALTNGIETYNCGDATENVIGSMENVTISAKGTGMLISAPCGTATNCTISGDVNGIEIWIKGNYSATLNLVDSEVEGGVYAHDEFNNNAGIVNNGTLSLTASGTTNVDADDITLVLARAENVGGLVKEVKDNAQAKLNDTYYATLAEAIKAAKAGDVVTVFEGTYAMPSMKAGITIIGEGEVVFEGTLSGTLENLTLKNLYIKGAHAQRWAYAKGDLVFENVTFEATSVYALHFDGITEGATLLYKDCTIIGWAAMSGSPASCVFDGCTIKGNGSYGLIRTYFDATIENCTFDVSDVNPDDVYQDGIHAVDATVTVNNCTNVNGVMKDIIDTSKVGYIVLDGEKIHFHKWVQGETVAPGFGTEGYTVYTCPCGETEERDVVPALVAVAKIGEAYYATLAEAIKAAKDGDEIDVISDFELVDTGAKVDGLPVLVAVDGKKITIDLNGKKITGTSGSKDLNYYAAFAVDNDGSLTLKDSVGTGSIEITGSYKMYSLLMAYEYGANNATKLIVEGGSYYLETAHDSLIFCGQSAGDLVYIKGGSFKLGNVGVGENGKPWIFNVVGAGDGFANVTGGTFNADVNRQHWSSEVYVAKECYTVDNGDGTFTVKEGAEAYVYTGMTTGPYFAPKNVGYKTLAEAIAAAEQYNDQKVTLLRDVTVESAITVAAGKAFTLDLNGKTVSYTSNVLGEFLLTNRGNVTIDDSSAEKNGKLSFVYNGAPDTSYGTMNGTIQNLGTLTIKNGTVENASAKMSHANYAINTNAGATLNVEGGKILNPNGHAIRMVSFGTALNTVTVTGGYIEGTRAINVQLPGSASSTTAPEMALTIKGGELKATEDTYALAVYAFSNGQSAENLTINIEGGIFNGNVAINGVATESMKANALTVTGGTFNSTYGVYSYADDAVAAPVISITGGTFTTNYCEFYAIDDGFGFEQNAEGTYNVVEGLYAAEINGVYYETIVAALNAAQAGDTVKVLNNVTYDGYLFLKPGVKLDLNGYTVTAAGLAAFGQDASVVDNGATKGLLAVPQGNLVMTNANYPMLPVYNEEETGYVFVEIEAQLKVKTESDDIDTVPDGGFVVKFKPLIKSGMSTTGTFSNGAADNGITYKVYVHCLNGGSVAETLDFQVSEDLISAVHTPNSGLAFRLNVKNAAGAYEAYQVEIVIESNTGVSYVEMSETITVTVPTPVQ